MSEVEGIYKIDRKIERMSRERAIQKILRILLILSKYAFLRALRVLCGEKSPLSTPSVMKRTFLPWVRP